jgi:hypothetical protein
MSKIENVIFEESLKSIKKNGLNFDQSKLVREQILMESTLSDKESLIKAIKILDAHIEFLETKNVNLKTYIEEVASGLYKDIQNVTEAAKDVLNLTARLRNWRGKNDE